MERSPSSSANPNEVAETTSSRPARRLRLMVQPYGVLLIFVGGFGSLFLSQVPQAHPAFGGPNPWIVLLVCCAYLIGSVVLTLPFIWLCCRKRFYWEFLYSIPPLAIAAYLGWCLFLR